MQFPQFISFSSIKQLIIMNTSNGMGLQNKDILLYIIFQHMPTTIRCISVTTLVLSHVTAVQNVGF